MKNFKDMIKANKDDYCVIMGGGIGSRFWPFSRTTFPKQFLDFLGTGRSLLQQTFDRFNNIIPTENILIVTNDLYADLIREQLPELKPEQILLEPMRRNTAPCVVWAAYHIRAINPQANIIVAPSDHLILKEGDFLTAVQKGLRFVEASNNLLTIGVKPNRPETGYGYIQIAEKKRKDIYKVKTFTEKPELELAKVFFESKEFYWNSGLFMWNVNTIIETAENLLPDLTIKLCSDKVYGTPDEKAFIDEQYPTCPNISVDYGIMEKADNVYVSLGDFGWSDMGTWGALYDISPKDKHRNVVLKGQSLLYNCNENIIALPKDKLVVIEGLSEYLVAESDNVLLICKKSEEHAIRKYVNDARIKMGDEYV
ncbi:Mannose-1-phosphate guanylyltransferase RfbM [termite gut metagenome]|uniref:Mannose-1-phosphate guanylyltransferase RfbM n=1 Tax=termite gut metagenome TaxID=433724 RepID=A0A5J4SEY0_9ZZZZ